jgi:hypothetical protein
MGSGLFAPSPGTNLNYPSNLNHWGAATPTPTATGLPTALLQALLQSYGGTMTPDLLGAATPIAQLGGSEQIAEQDLGNQLTGITGSLANTKAQIANMAPVYSGISSMLGSIGNLFGGGGGGAPAAAAGIPAPMAGIGASNPRGIIGSVAGGGAQPASGGGSSGGGLLGGLFGGGGIGGLLKGLLGGGTGGGTGAPTGGGTQAMGGFGAPLLAGFQSSNTPQGASLGGAVPGSPPMNGGWSGGRGPGPGGGYSFTGMPGGQGALAANAQAVPPAQRRMFNYAAGMGGTGGMMG